MFCRRSYLKLLNKILRKYLNKSSFLVKLQVLKMNSFTRIFQGFCSKFGLSNCFHDFCDDCFGKLKFLLAVNRLIYLNQWVYEKLTVPGPLACHSVLHRITTSEVTASYLFHEVENATSLYCENNYKLRK